MISTMSSHRGIFKTLIFLTVLTNTGLNSGAIQERWKALVVRRVVWPGFHVCASRGVVAFRAMRGYKVFSVILFSNVRRDQ